MVRISNGSLITNSGKKIIINRAYKSSPDYTVPSSFRVGISNGTPAIADTGLDVSIPIENGTVLDDGDNQLTGSSGADNSTDNSTTFKQGAGVSDAKSQNLLADNAGTNVLKIWSIADLSANGAKATATEAFGLWIYIKDATEYAKLKATGTAIEIKIGTDSSNYYSKTWTKSDLASGWNWLTSGTTVTNGLTETGTATDGDLKYFAIEVTTVNAGDEFAAGELLYDLLREWTVAERAKTFLTGYPTVDETNFETEIRCQLLSTNANGFDINGLGLINTDGTILFHSEDTFTAESKSSTDQFTFIVKDRLI